MPLTDSATIDFSLLQTPPGHGDVLVVPAARRWSALARENAARLSAIDVALCGVPLGEWRRRTREKLVGAERAAGLVVVLGHQPEFIHPGVWAKQVAAARFAEAIGGTALNLVVDSDDAKGTTLNVPRAAGEAITLETIRWAESSASKAYERLAPLTESALRNASHGARAALAERYAATPLSLFLDAAAGVPAGGDWVDQMVAGRNAIDASFGVRMIEQRVSAVWWTPLVGDMLLNAARFAAAYNRALSGYRGNQGVRDARRPMPDLEVRGARVELPLWAVTAGAARRRVLVERSGDRVRLSAEGAAIGDIRASELALDFADDRPGSWLGEWQLRPRALALTLWARLVLADWFVHGIGGAKYDRISDAIMADYYGIAPPHMACVSATLHLDLPFTSVTAEEVRARKRQVRDVHWNPQRYVEGEGEAASLLARRKQAVARAVELAERQRGDRAVRRRCFEEIREVTAALRDHSGEASRRAEADWHKAERALAARRLAESREYFFGLYPRGAMEQMMAALPAGSDFGV